jgi:hypothetical protein
MELDKDIITAFVDGEIKDENLYNDILAKIESDKEFAIDFKMQSLIKYICKEKVVFQTTPDKVRKKILKSLRPKQSLLDINSNFLTNLFEKPAFSFATAFVVILAIVLIVFNRSDSVVKKDFALEQLGSDNMFVQADKNFQSIVDGKLVPQIKSQSPEEIKKFFNSNGVKYITRVPSFADWSLLGAVVSEDKGEKFAHHVYTGKNGEIIYLFQVDESYLNKHNIISLSDDLIKYLDEGNCYSTVKNGRSSLLTKVDNNIWAVVANVDSKELKNNFCSYN